MHKIIKMILSIPEDSYTRITTFADRKAAQEAPPNLAAFRASKTDAEWAYGLKLTAETYSAQKLTRGVRALYIKKYGMPRAGPPPRTHIVVETIHDLIMTHVPEMGDDNV